ncbi:MAG: RNA polymerase sigma factor SigJ [Actinomycetota bacterium]|nr:RNA polymerase sigma factor SigJ [Actinomycetota bacterium]
MEAQRAAEIFAEQRNYLLGVSYRLTGSWADAEDVVAEAWPRWAAHADEVLNPRAWLTRVVGRLSLDHLRSARVRRETYVGPWLPEPLVSSVPDGNTTGAVGGGAGGGADTDPLGVLVRDESVRLAFLVVLDELSPEQRLALVLHDVVGMDFADIAEVIGCSDSTARQHASRGRRRLAEAKPPPRAAPDEAWILLGEMSAALFAGDVDRLSRLLAPDVVLLSDGAGKVLAAGRPVVGATEVGRFLTGLAKKFSASTTMEPVLVNGDPGFLVRVDSTRPQDPKIGVYTMTIRDGKIAGLYAVLAPDKLTHLT